MCPKLMDDDRQVCSNSLPDLFLSPTSSCNCTNGLLAAEMAPPEQQLTELKFFVHHARRGFLTWDGGLVAWPFPTNAWSPEDTDHLGNNLLDYRMQCARGTLVDGDFSEVDPSLEGVYTNQTSQEDRNMGHANPAAQQENTASFGGSLPPTADQTFAAGLLPIVTYPAVNHDALQGEPLPQNEANLNDLAFEEEQPTGDDQSDADNEAGPSSSRRNSKRSRTWSKEETQLLLNLHAERDAKGKRVWTYTRMKVASDSLAVPAPSNCFEFGFD